MMELQQALARQGVHTLIAQFTDVHGVAKGKLLPLDQLGSLLSHGAGFSGPSIWGTGLPRMGPRSEYHGRGDAATARALPWMPGFARLACDGYVNGAVFEACPRQVLKRQLARLAERGWSLQTGIEPEFFLLRRNGHGAWLPADLHDQLPKPSYDLKSLARQAPWLTQLGAQLRACGLEVFQTDHEDAQGQYELNFLHADALTSADHLMLFKLAAHAMAEAQGLVFSMMPKPFANQPGSGMHFHLSLWQGQGGSAQNLLTEPDGQLSARGRHFVAGLLYHAPALCAVAAPTVNSYKRLVVGESLSGTSWAPAFVAHGPNNRTALVRTLADRVEWRLPDASANPYLATATLIAAGLDGVDRQLDPGPACDDDLFAMPLADIRARAIPALPQQLGEALAALSADSAVLAALGDTLSTQFLSLKHDEWTAYRRHVSDWELQRYVTAF